MKGKSVVGKLIDIVGNTYGFLKVVRYIRGGKWLCECICGNTKIVQGNSLKAGLTKSCGCYRKEGVSILKLNDIKRLQFGEWEVLSYLGKSRWICRCSCGIVRNVKSQSLKSGTSRSCGHSTTGFKDLCGQKLKGWEVLDYIGNQEYNCRCIECSIEKRFKAYAIKEGLIGICGCSRVSANMINIAGAQFGELTVIKYVGENKWLCKCSCGEESIHFSHNLRRSETISCGCAEVKGYEKEYITKLIEEYKKDNLRLPYRFELEALLSRSQTSVERYIKRYNLYEYINSSTRSRGEEEIIRLFPTYAINYRHILKDGKELDVLYPENKLALEFNGIYWHSTLFKEADYHQNKTIGCAKQGIHLIHIFEYEWRNLDTKRKLIDYLSLIMEEKTNNIVQSSETSVMEITNTEAVNFCNKYHLESGIESQYNIGIHSRAELIGVMTLNKQDIADNNSYEILRSCFKAKTVIVDGAKKMLQYFISKYAASCIVTYIDISKFTGNEYIKLDFKSIHITDPTYVWCNSKYQVIQGLHSIKHELIGMGIGDKDDTEDDIMLSLGYYKIYNSGTLRMEWNSWKD